MNDLLSVGFTSRPIGLKGEIKVLSNERFQDKIFKVGNTLVINNESLIIKTSRIFKDHYIISFEDYQDINLLDRILHQDIYIERSQLHLQEDDYLYADLIGLTIIDQEKRVGVVKELLLNKNTVFIKDEQLIIPLIDKYLVKIALSDQKIYVQNSKELLL